MSNNVTDKNEKFYYSPVKVAAVFIALACMICFRFIPAPEPMTQLGMTFIGLLVGYLIMLSVVDMVWSSFVLCGMIAFDIMQAFPDASVLDAGVEVCNQSFGGWIGVLVLCCIIITYALEENGLLRRVAFWFVTRKIAKKSPFMFSMMFLLSVLVVGMFIDDNPSLLFGWGLAYEFFALFGIKKDEPYARFIINMVNVTAIASFCMTPFCHVLPLLWMSMHDQIAGVSTSFVQYMMVGIPVGLVIFFLSLAWYKFVVKPDMSKLESFDFDKLEAMRPGPMTKNEKATAVIFILLVLSWIIPGILTIAAPDFWFTEVMNNLGTTVPAFFAIALLCFVGWGKKPALVIKEAFNKIDVSPYFLLVGIMVLASCVTYEGTGITAFLGEKLAFLGGISEFWFVLLMAIIAMALSNVFDNVPVGTVVLTAAMPIAMAAGYGTVGLAIAITIGTNLVFIGPAGNIQTALTYKNEWVSKGCVFKHGVIVTIICIIALALIQPLSALFGFV